MKFYQTRFEETHIIFVDEEVDDIFEFHNEYTNYRFAGRFPDYAAIKKELKHFIYTLDPMGFDSVEIKEGLDIPGLGLDPGGYGEIYDVLFIGHDIQYIVALRRLSFYWFTLEIFEDRFSKIFRRITSQNRTDEEESLDDILKKYRPIKSFRFRKFK